MRLCHCLWIAAIGAAGCREPIQHALDERQANEVQSVLAERGFDARKVIQTGRKPTWSVEVPSEQSSDAIRVLAELGLPRPRAEGISDVFGKGSLVPTPTEERALYQEAVSGELSQTLEAVDGVVSARVHVVLPPPPRPGAAVAAAKASAFIRVRPGMSAALGPMRDDLRALIAGAVEGLAADQVTLVMSEVAAAAVARPSAIGDRPLLRSAVAALGATVSLLSAAMVFLVVRRRRPVWAKTGRESAAPGQRAFSPRAPALAAVPTRPPTRRPAQ